MRRLAVLALLLTGCFPILNYGLLLNTGDVVTTKFDLSKIVNKPHSVSFRVMFRYPHTFYNDLIGEGTSGSYSLVKNDYGSNVCANPAPALAVAIGGGFASFPNPHDPANGFAANTWYTVIFTVDSGMQLSAFVDGLPAGTTSLQASPTWATGTVQFGQRAAADVDPHKPEQLWGLLDDVAFWDHALGTSEIASVVQQPRINAGAAGVLASYTFDQYQKEGTGPTDSDPVTGNRVPINGDNTDSSVFDHNPPAQKTVFSLPVKGQWTVTQGSDSACGSHSGYASFSVDLMYHNDQNQTQGKPIYAAADGTVTMIRDTSPDAQPNETVPGCTVCAGQPGSCDYPANEVTLKHADGEYSSYLHLGPGTVPRAIKAALASGATVHKGDVIGYAGRSGTHDYHVHFAMLWTETLPATPVTSPGTDTPNTPCGFTPAVPDDKPLVTRPFSFTDVWLQANSTGSFQHLTTVQLHYHDTFCDTQSCQ